MADTSPQLIAETEKDVRHYWWIKINGLPIGFVDSHNQDMIMFSMQFIGDWEEGKIRRHWTTKLLPRMMKACVKVYPPKQGYVYRFGEKFLAVHSFGNSQAVSKHNS